MDFIHAWEQCSEKMVRDLCGEEEFVHESGVLPSPGMVDHLIDLCWLKMAARQESIRKSDLGGFLRHKLGKRYKRGWLKVILLKRMHVLGLIQSISSDIIRRRAIFSK